MRARLVWLLKFVCVLFAIIFSVAFLSACSKQENQVPELQTADAPIDARKQSDAFEILAAGPSLVDGETALNLKFSQPLAAAQDFDAFIRVQGPKGELVKSGWVLSRDARVLRFPNVQPAQTYRVSVKAGIAAANGRLLKEAFEQEVFTGPLKPAVGFASQGQILPARDTRGLPVVSINVPEVDVEFWRVKDSEVANFFVRYQRNGRRDVWELDNDYSEYGEGEYSEEFDDGNDAQTLSDKEKLRQQARRKRLSQLAESVYLNRFVLGGEDNQRTLSYLPIQNIEEMQRPGLYLALMNRSGKVTSTYETALFFVSDIGLHLRAYSDRMLVHAASLKDGEPIFAVALEVVDLKGETRLKAETDGEGNALMAYSLDADDVLLARKDKDYSVLSFNQPALDLSQFAVAGREQAKFDVFAWSGRDLYRPGETLRLSALMRNHDGRLGKPQPLFVSLRQPDGRAFIETQIQAKDMGYYEWSQVIPADAATGRWAVEFRTSPGAKEVVQGMQVRVEEFLPERMKLELDSPQQVLAPGQSLKLQATAAYLYGAPASGNRFTARMALNHAKHPIENLKEFHFGNPDLPLPRDADDVLDTSFDVAGKLQADVPLPKEAQARGPIEIVLNGSVYETGGRPVSRGFTRTIWPAAQLVGIRPLFALEEGASFDQDAGFEILRADRAGTVRAAQRLKVSLMREERKYHWQFEEDGGWSYDYTSTWKAVENRVIDTVDGKPVRVAFPMQWGEYRLDVFDPQTKLLTRLPFYAGWRWDDGNQGIDARPDKVKIALDKTHYRAGDTLKLTVTPPHPGQGLLIVEAGKLLHVQNISAKPGASFEVKVTPEWERHDVYVSAVVFRGGSAASKITPARAFGVVHVPMDRSERKVTVTLSAPKQTKPDQDWPVNLHVPALAGKKAFVTLSAVDLGILNITRFPVPDAAAHFFAQRRYAVNSYDVYGRVIESYDGEQARLRFGGDAALQALPQARRPTAKVNTVDVFKGPVQLDASGRATVKLRVEDFNGAVRVSALVFNGEQFGKADSETIIRAPVVAEASVPRVLAPGDVSRLSLDVQNFTGRAGTFQLSWKTEGPISLAASKETLSLADGRKASRSFELRAKPGYGVGAIELQLSGVGIDIRRRFEVPVRAGWSAVSRSRMQVVEGGTASFDASLLDGLLEGSTSARFAISKQPPIPFAAALGDLLNYPYGCAEQTTSRGYAALLLDEDTAKGLGMKGLGAEQRRKRLEGAFTRLAALQGSNGHFSLWGGDGSYEAVLTPFITQFLLDAKAQGFAVPEALLQKGLERMSEDLLSGSSAFYGYAHSEHLRFAYQAQSGYALAQVNRAPLGTLRAMFDHDRGKSLSGLPLVQLGIALHLQGDKGRARKAIAEGLAKVSKRPGWLGDYGSELRDEAMMLALLKRHGLGGPAADQRLLTLAKNLRQRMSQQYYWLSTQEQIALALLGREALNEGGAAFDGEIVLGGKSEALKAKRSVSRLIDTSAASTEARFNAATAGPFYVISEVSGIPRTPPAFDNSKMLITREWFRMDGSPFKGGTLKEGETLVVRLTVRSDVEMKDALVVDLLPAGLEVENLNLIPNEQLEALRVDGVSMASRGGNAKHEEFREDRYVAAIHQTTYQPTQLYYLVRAVTPGDYGVPPPQIEDMYRPELRAVGRALPERLKVVKP